MWVEVYGFYLLLLRHWSDHFSQLSLSEIIFTLETAVINKLLKLTGVKNRMARATGWHKILLMLSASFL